MSYTVADLIQMLALEPLELNIFRGSNRDIGTGRIFGGQVLAQALVAARRTVEEDRPAHSVHGYFMLEGDLTVPVVYFVDRIRDGRSFTTRTVRAIQHGHAIFAMTASFQRTEEGLTHQPQMPDVPPPEKLDSELDLLRAHADELNPQTRKVLTQDRPLDFRPVPDLERGSEPKRCVWMRAIGSVGDEPLHHQAVLAYASDYGLLGAALKPHGVAFRDPSLILASLDHAVWFHRPCRVDDWLLHVIESPTSAGARAFARGAFYTRDGTLVASTAQEGLMRMRRPQG
jgi:acyl-CoA thioesterase-2